MKKLAIALGLSFFALAATASAAESTIPVQGSEAVAQGPEWDSLCHDAIRIQDQRIRDLRAAIDYDKQVEQKLLDGIAARERDAAVKEDHARKWRDFAGRADQGKRDTLIKFAVWLETEARTDHQFASERREALRVINRQWNQANNDIAGHQQNLADLHSFCGY